MTGVMTAPSLTAMRLNASPSSLGQRFSSNPSVSASVTPVSSARTLTAQHLAPQTLAQQTPAPQTQGSQTHGSQTLATQSPVTSASSPTTASIASAGLSGQTATLKTDLSPINSLVNISDSSSPVSKQSRGGYSLSQGALGVNGLINRAPGQVAANPPASQGQINTGSGASETSAADRGEANGIGNIFAKDQVETIINPAQEDAGESAGDPAAQQGSGANVFSQTDAREQQGYDPFKDKEVDAEQLDRAQEAELQALAKRDAEVRAHEQAHASVGGTFARSPSFKYEQGSDGRRYAVDGEVAIDISSVPGDPLATLNKMKQVYAAAMAPMTPSMADIRVASEALRKMNAAKAELAQERQQSVMTPKEMQPLIDAGKSEQQRQLPDPVTPKVAGQVNDKGQISASRVDSPSALDNDRAPSQTIERISRQILENKAEVYSQSALNARYQGAQPSPSSFAFSL
ncbi:putative metalloprotease CJM1_0395 family protein [Shewanella marisflavi]|uniref:putative metalloprotease CJM1_0395 family protein n=1 Tax=Shewanella marisflavi TaxID=260364 RepID=UPI003AAF2D8A